MANDTVTVQFRLQAAFGAIQALRQALADEVVQHQLISLLSETFHPFLARQIEAEFDLAVALKVSAVSPVRPGPRLPLPKVEQGQLTWYDPYADRINTVGTVGSAEWQQWLAGAGTRSFRYESDQGAFTAVKEKQQGRWVWYAHRRQGGHLKRVYLGRPENLTAAKLTEVARKLTQRPVSLIAETGVNQGGNLTTPSE